MKILEKIVISIVFLFSLSANATDLVPIKISLPEAVFAAPTKIVNSEANTTIRNKLIGLINATPKNSSIYFMVFLLNDAKLQDALINAQERGVKVNVVIDWSNDESKTTNPSAFAALNGKVKSIVKVSNPIGIIHNKFALFTEINTTNGAKSNVIFESSSNFTCECYTKFQDAVILQDNKLFNDGFKPYWDYIVGHNSDKGLKAYDYRNQLGDSNRTKAYFFPKRKNNADYGADTVVKILDNVITGCQKVSGSGANIKIAMSLWSESREEILSKLKTIADNNNSTIEIIIPNKSVNGDMIAKLKTFANAHSNVALKVISQNLHSKYMLIDSEYADQGRQKIVFAGSANFTKPSLRSNFETWIKYIADETVGSDKIYQAYLANFQAIK